MNLVENVKWLPLTAVLVWNSITDIKYRKISVISMLILGIAGVAIAATGIITGQSFFQILKYVLLGSVPGLAMCILSLLSRGSLGMGDGILILMLGICTGIREMSVVLTWAFLLASVWAMGMLVIKKKNRYDSFPFVPFITIGFFINRIF